MLAAGHAAPPSESAGEDVRWDALAPAQAALQASISRASVKPELAPRDDKKGKRCLARGVLRSLRLVIRGYQLGVQGLEKKNASPPFHEPSSAAALEKQGSLAPA